MTIIFDPRGTASCLYGETIDLHTLGRLRCTRATEVEFNADTQQWEVRRTRNVLFSSPSRQACLEWEQHNITPA